MTESTMVQSDKTARQLFEEVKANPARARFGFGERVAIVNVDPQKGYTRPDLFPKTAYITDPAQVDHIRAISDKARAKGFPVVWTHVAFMDNAADAGVWGTRTDTPDSLQNIKYGSDRHAFDDRLTIDETVDAVYTKRMPSAFFETPLASFLTWHKVDTVVVTGGSPRVVCGPRRWMPSPTAIGPLCRRSVWPISMKAIILRTSRTFSLNMPMWSPCLKCTNGWMRTDGEGKVIGSGGYGALRLLALSGSTKDHLAGREKVSLLGGAEY